MALRTLNQRLMVVRGEELMYTTDGAQFQEWALANVDCYGSEAYRAIGRLVTAINNAVMSVEIAKMTFNGLKATQLTDIDLDMAHGG